MWKFVSVIRNGATTLSPADVGLPAGEAYLAYELCASRPLARPCTRADMLPAVQPFSAASPVALPASSWSDTDGAEARLVVAAPVAMRPPPSPPPPPPPRSFQPRTATLTLPPRLHLPHTPSLTLSPPQLLPCGLALLGEESKLVPLSPNRVAAFSCATGSDARPRLEVEVRGAAGEAVSLLAADPSPSRGAASPAAGGIAVLRTQCRIGNTGRARMVLAGSSPGEPRCQ